MKTRLSVKLIMALLAVAIAFSAVFALELGAETVQGTFGDGDNLKWSVDTSAGVLSISGEGDMSDFNSPELTPWAEYSDSIVVLNIGEGVLSVGKYAFAELDGLGAVSLPSTLGSIGERAFYSCDSLRSLALPDNLVLIGDFAFCGCIDLRVLKVGNSLKDIGASAFRGCYSLGAVDLPDSLETVGDNAFSGCQSLRQVTVGSGLVSVGMESFFSCNSLERAVIASADAEFAHRDCFGANTWVYAPAGSTAQTYALKHGKKFVELPKYSNSSALLDLANLEYRADSVIAYVGDGVSKITVSEEALARVGGKPLTLIAELAEITFDSLSASKLIGCGTDVTVKLGNVTEDRDFLKLSVVVTDANGNRLLEANNGDNGSVTVRTTYISGVAAGKVTADGETEKVISYNSESGEVCFVADRLGELTVSRIRGVAGDVNGDRRVTAEDIAILRRYLAGWANYSLHDTNAANVNDDGKVDGDDLLLMRVYLAGVDCELINNTDLIPAEHEHDYVELDSVDASCTHAGYSGGVACSVCADVLEMPKYIPALAHRFENGACRLCIANYKISEGLEFEETDGGYKLVGIGICTDSDLVIPSLYNGKSVVEIADRAFYENADITSVIIPTSVKRIGALAFYKNYSLTSAALSEGIEYIGNEAFEYCIALEDVTVPDSVEEMGNGVFMGCYALKEATLGKGLEKISKDSFFGCYDLETLNVNFVPAFVGGWSLQDCESLSVINCAASAEQWTDAYFGEYWDTNTAEYIVICSDKSLHGHVYGEWNNISGCLDIRYCDICLESESRYHHSYTATRSLVGSVMSESCSDCGALMVSYEAGENILAFDFEADKTIEEELKSYEDFRFIADGSATGTTRNTYETIGTRSVWDVEAPTFIDFDANVLKDVDYYTVSFDMYLGDNYKSHSSETSNSVFSFLGGSQKGGFIDEKNRAFGWVIKYFDYTENGVNKRLLATQSDKSKITDENSVEVSVGTWISVKTFADAKAGKMHVYVNGEYLGTTSSGLVNYENPIYNGCFALRFSDQTCYDTHFDNFRITKVEPHIFSEWEKGSNACEQSRICLDCGESETKVVHTGSVVETLAAATVYRRCNACNETVDILRPSDDVLKLDFDKSVAEEIASYNGFSIADDSKNAYVNLDGRSTWDLNQVTYINYDKSVFESLDKFNISFDLYFDNSTDAVRDSSVLSFVCTAKGNYNWMLKYVAICDKLATKAVNTTSDTKYSTKDAAKNDTTLTQNNSVVYTPKTWVTVNVLCDTVAKKMYTYIDDTYIGIGYGFPNFSTYSSSDKIQLRFLDVTSYGAHIDNFVISKMGSTLEKPDYEVSQNGLDSMLTELTTADDVKTVEVSEDTYVQDNSNTDTHGSETELTVKRSSASGYDRAIFLEFDISKADVANVNNAELMLECVSMEDKGIDTTLNIYSVDPDSWDEATLTYAEYQSIEKGELVAQEVINNTGPCFIDVTNFVKSSSGKIAFLIEGVLSESRRINFASSESEGNSPTLVLNYGEANFIAKIPYDTVNPWEKAMSDVSEWIVRWNTLKSKSYAGNEAVEMISSEYNLSVGVSSVPVTSASGYTKKPTRTVDSLIDFTANSSETAMYDEYGGFMDESMRQTATGFFYTKKIGDRWWAIDPLGYPFFRVACVQISHGSSPNQKKLTLQKYPSVSDWADAATQRVREIGFNSTGGWSDLANLSAVSKPLAQTQILYVLRDYCASLGLDETTSGNTALVGNVLPVFDIAFAEHTDNYVKTAVESYANSPCVYGWMSDNELPQALNMLDNSLSFDPSDKRFSNSYATAWTFMYLKTGNISVSISDVTDELRDEYRAMVYDKYLDTVSSALEKYAPNHMYLGCRLLTSCAKSESIMRVAGYWCDVISFNYYNDWTPDFEFISNLSKWTDAPFIATEWYAKGMDACTAENGLTNESGAGFVVATQSDRGKFYQNFALGLMESKVCVGFDWFKYWDNDPTDTAADLSNRDANKGILDNSGKEYSDLVEYMEELNNQKYSVISFFDQRNAK